MPISGYIYRCTSITVAKRTYHRGERLKGYFILAASWRPDAAEAAYRRTIKSIIRRRSYDTYQPQGGLAFKYTTLQSRNADFKRLIATLEKQGNSVRYRDNLYRVNDRPR